MIQPLFLLTQNSQTITRCRIFFSPAATYKSSKNPQSSKNPTKKKKKRLKSLAVVYTHKKKKKQKQKKKERNKNPPLLKSSTRSSSQQLVFHSPNKVLQSKIFSKIGSQELNHTIITAKLALSK
jgi:hypothetical protein